MFEVELESESNVNCPDLPEWLESADIKAREGKSALIPAHLTSLLSLYRRAYAQNYETAEMLAERYETGDLPCGASIPEAIKWHSYAAELGSVKSALRLARLHTWLSTDFGSAVVKPNAVKAITNSLKGKYAGQQDLTMAAQAAMLLLDYRASGDDLLLIEELLENRRFGGHPDKEVIKSKLQLTRCQRGDAELSLKVASAKISEDGDFKAGIYSVLERPLPLVQLPDADFVKQTLDIEFPWFEVVNEQIYRQIVVQQHSSVPAFKLRPLLIAGAPGVGKTSWVKRLAELCNVPFRSVMAGGGNDAMFLRGTPRGWASTRPGGVLQTMATELVANPIFLIDELDKASSDGRNGRIWDVLLQMLEPSTARVYLDECLQVPCDLSWVSWIATVNEIVQLPKPLLERFTVAVVQAPGAEHFNTCLLYTSV